MVSPHGPHSFHLGRRYVNVFWLSTAFRLECYLTKYALPGNNELRTLAMPKANFHFCCRESFSLASHCVFFRVVHIVSQKHVPTMRLRALQNLMDCILHGSG